MFLSRDNFSMIARNMNIKYSVNNLKVINSDNDKYDYSMSVTSLIKRKIATIDEIKISLDKTIENYRKGKIEYVIEDNKDNYYVHFTVTQSYLDDVFKYIDHLDLLYNKYVCCKETILVDYTSPNVAKDMHVGHMRSMFIGDALSKLCEYIGHNVLKISHIGDFGLQFGMIINYILKYKITTESMKDDPSSLQKIYSNAKKEFDENEEFNKKSYQIIQSIHNDDKSEYQELWQEIKNISLASYDKIFNKVNIKQEIIGESFYKQFAKDTVEKCLEDFPEIVYKNDDGRIIAFGDKKIVPLTLMKSDGAYTYDTTDLCAIEYRVKKQFADKIFYVVDTGQALHFKQLFAVARKIGFEKVELEHINFGVILGEDKKRIRSRDGDTPKLIDMFEDCFNETKKVFDERETKHDDKTIDAVSLSSLRYANLAIKRETDFIFSLDKILAFKGNTYMYILYAYIRCKSISRKLSEHENTKYEIDNSILDTDYAFLRKLLKFRDALDIAFNNRDLSHLCEYMFSLVEHFHSYYKSTRIMNFEGDILISLRKNALELIKLCTKILFDCFYILGLDSSIEAI